MESLNIEYGSKDPRARILSNLAATPFVLDGVGYISIEGFWVSLKFPEGSAERIKARGLYGHAAKSYGRRAVRHGTFFYRGVEIGVGSSGHHALMRKALERKFWDHPTARQMLIATEGLTLTHVLHKNSITIPGSMFTGMLMEIRESLLAYSAYVAEKMSGGIDR